jgi:hypothetical protein
LKHVLLLVALFFAAHSALGQTNTDPAAADPNTQQQVEYQPVYQQPHDAPPIPPPPPTPPPAATQGRTDRASGSERWRYDPAARRGDGEQRPSNESGIERALKGINPCNVPYGGLLSEWHIAAVQETIENVYFWALLVLCCIVVLSTAYNAWLLQKLENREQITGAIIAQLSNAHIFARRKALEAIEAHNKLVKEIDAEDDAGEEQSIGLAATSTVGLAASCLPDTTGTGPSEAPRAARCGEDTDPVHGPFALKPKAVPAVHADSDQNGNENEAVPLHVKATRFALSQQAQPPAKASIPVEESEAGVTLEALPVTEKDTQPSDAEDVDAIKLALRKATETVSVQAAQLATKDAQLRAKDDKITSQRQLVSDLNNKLKVNGATGSGGK